MKRILALAAFAAGLASCTPAFAASFWDDAQKKSFSAGAVCQYLDAVTGLPVPCDATHPLPVNASVSVASVAHAQTGALASKLVVKAAAGNLASFEVSADATLSASAWWVMVYDATDVPADGAVTPAKCYAIPAGATAFTAGFPSAISFTTGISIGVSSDGCFNKVASTHAFIAADYQ